MMRVTPASALTVWPGGADVLDRVSPGASGVSGPVLIGILRQVCAPTLFDNHGAVRQETAGEINAVRAVDPSRRRRWVVDRVERNPVWNPSPYSRLTNGVV